MKIFENTDVKVNLIKGISVYNGYIHFYEDGIEFVAYGIDSSMSMGKILYEKIDGVKAENVFLFVPNCFSILLKDGTTIKFISNNRNSIIKYIKDKLS